MGMTYFPGANYVPPMKGYSGQGAFRFWCQTVLPLVYDDSLSYYELLNKMVVYLNNTISDVANMEDNVGALHEAYSDLQSYVNEHFEELVETYNTLEQYVSDYFTNLDVQHEIDTKLDEMAENGSLLSIIQPVVVASAIEAVEDWLAEHITPTTPVVDNTLSISGAAADAKSVGDKLFSVMENGSYDVFRGLLTPATGTHNGVTYSWSGDTCTVTTSGATETNSVNVLLATSDIPSWVNKTATYKCWFNSTNAKLLLRIIFKNGSTDLSTVYVRGNYDVSIPENANKWTIAILAVNGADFSTPITVTLPKMILATSNNTLDCHIKELYSANTHDLLATAPRMYLNYNGITFLWNDEGTVCTANGTSTGATQTLAGTVSTVPDGFEVGKTYLAHAKSSSEDFYFRVLITKSDNTLIFVNVLDSDRTFTVPLDTVGLMFQLAVPNGKTVTNETVADIYVADVTGSLMSPQEKQASSSAPYNCVDILDGYARKDETHYGITYKWTDNKNCSVSGTLEAGHPTSRNNLFYVVGDNALPAEMERGKSYRVFFNGTNVMLCFIFYKTVGGEITEISDTRFTSNGIITVPADAEGLRIRLIVTTSSTVSETVTPIILNADTNKELSEASNTRVYTYEDMTHGGYWYLGALYSELYFRDTRRAYADDNWSRILIPVRAGDTVQLNTVGGSGNAKAYAIISHDTIIKEIYTTTPEFSGTLNITDDGWLAVNCRNTNGAAFGCRVIPAHNSVPTRAVCMDAQTNDQYIQFPRYDPNNVCKSLRYGQTLASMIRHWAIIGASFDSGEFNYRVGSSENLSEIEEYDCSCWEHWRRLNGINDIYLYANGGQNAKDWVGIHKPRSPLSDIVGEAWLNKYGCVSRSYAYDSDEEVTLWYWDTGVSSVGTVPGRSGVGHAGGNWWKMREDYLDGNVKQAFIINLGSNDINNNYPHDENWETLESYNTDLYYTCGTTEDIGTYDLATDTDTVPAGKTAGVVPGIVNSYAAYIGAVLNRILAIQPDAIIFLCTIRSGFDDNQNRYNIWLEYNDMLRQIAAMDRYKDNVYIVDNAKFGPSYNCNPMIQTFVGNHPNALGYQYLTAYWNTMIDYIIQTNYTKMKQSMFIGTGKSYTP